MNISIDIQTARDLINRLKSGTSPIDHVKHLNVGNESWYKEAGQYLDELRFSPDSLVRFIKGYYGDGKTHFLGMLRATAFDGDWLVSYVTAEKTPLNRFDRVYSEIIKSIVIPPNIPTLDWVVSRNARGARALLGTFFSKIFKETYRPGDSVGLKRPAVVEYLKSKSEDLAYKEGLTESVGKAIRGYTEAIICQDKALVQEICAWLEGNPVKIPKLGINRQIDRLMSRDAMRSISLISKESNISGLLILFDEAERIMKQSKPTRNSSYGIIRDLLDNADKQSGMQSSMMYIAATPEMFSDERGFAENDALRSRLDIAERFAMSEYVDYRSVIVDITKTPLTHEMLCLLAEKIRTIHCIARGWSSEDKLNSDAIDELVRQIEQSVFQISKPRMLSATTATLLDIMEQNRHANAIELINKVLNQVQESLPIEQVVETWE